EVRFQCIERMRYVCNLNVSSRLIFTVAIFVFVRERADYYIVPLLNSIAMALIGVWSLALIYRDFGIRLKVQRIDTLKKTLEDGWHVFTSRIYLNLYTTTITVLLGLLANNTVVGYYSAAEKLVMAIGGLFDPVNQAVYPFLARAYENEPRQFALLIKKIAIFLSVSSLVVYALSVLLGSPLVRLLFGTAADNIISIYL